MEQKILRITNKPIEFDVLMLLLQYWQFFPLPRLGRKLIQNFLVTSQGDDLDPSGPRIPLISEMVTASTYPQMSG